MKKIIILLGLSFPFLTTYSQELVPDNNEALVNVLVLDNHEIPEKDATIIFKENGKNLSIEGITDTAGTFRMIIPQGKKYEILIQKYGYDFDFGVKEIPNMDGPIEFNMKFKIGIDTSYEEVYTLENVYFDYDKASLRPESNKALNELVEVMQTNTGMIIEIAGHTDNKGSDDYNLRLSQKRAETVRAYLLSKGIGEKRVFAKGYGETTPVAFNDTEAGRQKNRRTEVRIIKK